MNSLEDKIRLAMELDNMSTPPTSPLLNNERKQGFEKAAITSDDALLFDSEPPAPPADLLARRHENINGDDNKEQVQVQTMVGARNGAAPKSTKATILEVKKTPQSEPLAQEKENPEDVKTPKTPVKSPTKPTTTSEVQSPKSSGDANGIEGEMTENGRTSPSRRKSVSGGPSKLYDRAAEIRAAKDKLREDYIKNDCSFSPKLVSSKKLRANRATTPGKSRTDMLYEDASVRKAKEKELEGTSTELAECTFQPRINSGRKTPLARGTSPAKHTESLFARAREIEEKKKALMEQHLQEEAKKCSFKPQITAKARTARPPSPSHGARVEELHKQFKEKAEKNQAEKEQRELAGCTFQPKINRRRSSGVVAPSAGSVQERLAQYSKTLEEKREALKKKQEEEEKKHLTFRPSISRPSTPGKNAPQGSIHERLYHQAQKKESEQEDSASRRPSSAPRTRVSSNSSEIFERLSAPKPTPTVARIEDPVSPNDLKECTFQPNVRKTAQHSSTRVGGESLFDRLYKDGSGAKELREQQAAAQCSFSPDVRKSQKSAPANTGGRPVWQRLSEEGKKVKEREEELEKAKAEMELAECSFQPKILKSGSSTPSSKPFWDRLTDPEKLAEKQKNLEIQKEQEEMKDCTFKPKTSPKASDLKASPSPAAAAAKTPSLRKPPSYLDKVRTSRSSTAKKKTPQVGEKQTEVNAPAALPEPLVALQSPNAVGGTDEAFDNGLPDLLSPQRIEVLGSPISSIGKEGSVVETGSPIVNLLEGEVSPALDKTDANVLSLEKRIAQAMEYKQNLESPVDDGNHEFDDLLELGHDLEGTSLAESSISSSAGLDLLPE